MPTQGSRFTFACPSIVSQPAKGTVGQRLIAAHLAESGGHRRADRRCRPNRPCRGSPAPVRGTGARAGRHRSRPAPGPRPTMLAVSRRAWASRSPASARASCRVRSAPSVAAWVSFSASVRALATFCSASWLAVSTALKALTALRGRLDCTSTRTTWMPSPLPAAANAARLWLMPCTRSPRRRSRRSATALSLPSNSGRATRMVSRSRAAQTCTALRATSRSSAGSTWAPWRT